MTITIIAILNLGGFPLSQKDEQEVILNEVLTKQMEAEDQEFRERNNEAFQSAPAPPPSSKKPVNDNHTQWAMGGNGRFSPVGNTAARLPAGIYEPFAVPGQWGLELTTVASDGIYILPDMATEAVLDEVNKFWDSEAKYRNHNLLYKRGILLFGPPGGGKTVAVKLLMNELVKKDGIVIVAQNINLVIMCLKAVRRIEPKRNLIVVLEDIDEIINYNGESSVLSMLDGENNVDNILHLATTNYPDRLGARIINRPSRFDRRVEVGMPSADARTVYLEKATNNGLSKQDLTKWVQDTHDMSIAHMRELVAAVYCLGQNYKDVIERLQKMANPVKAEDGFASKSMGFKSKQAPYFAGGLAG